LPAAKDLLERLAQLYGVGKARAMQQVDHESGAYEVTGYAALPSVTEASRSRQTLSVNGRWVRAESLTKGIDDAYRATVPAGRYPPVHCALRLTRTRWTLRSTRPSSWYASQRRRRCARP
jgi:DNA mismatch repair protein MutL